MNGADKRLRSGSQGRSRLHAAASGYGESEMRKLLLFVLVCCWWNTAAFAAPRTSLLTCDLGSGYKATLLGEAHGIEGKVLFLDINGNVEKAFLDFPDASLVGNVVLAKCVDHVLVFAMNYGPPYLKGMAVRFNADTSRIEQINFSEKSLPSWIYTNPRSLLVVFPNKGHESNKRFVVYQFVAGEGQGEEPEGFDTLPKRVGYKAIRVRH